MDSTPPPAPQQMGAFLIEKELWHGTNSKVYRAKDTRDNVTVALKILFPSDECSLEFQKGVATREAAHLKLLSHGNIVPLRKHGEIDGIPYLSFPYIEGQGVDLVVKEEVLVSPVLMRGFYQEMVLVCQALHHAHTKGVIHRDLKPRNLWVTSANKLLVLDWGLAWKIGSKADRKTQQIVGTPAYMSPEQARGEEDRLTPASDVYSLGAILYFLLTGKPPFEASSSWKTIQMVMSMPPRPPSLLNKDVDPLMEKVAMCALSKSSEKRYPSALAMGEDISRVLKRQNPYAGSGFWHRMFNGSEQ